jgi:hypothetical protein
MTLRWRALAGTAMVAGLVLAACSNEPAANDVEVGACTNEDLSGSVGEIDTVDCDESHTLEVFAVFDLDGDEYPGDEEIITMASEGCTGDRFEDYVGVPYQQSEVFAGWLPPSEATWNDADDRTVICFAGNQDGSPREGSVKGLDA